MSLDWMTAVTRQGAVECGKRTPMLRTVPALILGLLLGVVTASACGPSRTCSSVTCTGCCDTTGECRSGFDNSACGTKGGSCSTCGLGSTCLSGACSLNNSGAGTATGGGSSGTGGGFVTAGGSAGGASAGGASGGGSVAACNSTTCPGCCDANGACFTGRVDVACGANGASCTVCPNGQQCTALVVGGRCLGNPTGGGSAGGGSAVGGGSSGCNAGTCAGCCRSNGTCQVSPTSAQCGANGGACTACPSTQTCQSGACRSCAGCIDLGTGACLPGTSATACGSSGGSCSSCSGTTPFCTSQRCTASPPPTCSASTCSGCCDSMSGQCIPRLSQSATQCGQGTNGAACVSCGLDTCDTSAGQCMGGFPGLDGGLPGLDGGFGSVCASGAQCGPGECCYLLFGLGGVCAGIGNPNLLGGTTCGVSQMMCGTSCMGVQACVSGTCF